MRYFHRFNKHRPSTSAGMSYIEVLSALSIISIMGTIIMPMVPRLLITTEQLKKETRLIELGYYVGDYVTRWGNFSETTKLIPFNFFGDNQELELLSGEKKINSLPFSDSISYIGDPITDHYKTSIKFFETTSLNRAVLTIRVWYDDNLDNKIDTTESQVTYSTILIEKQ